MERSLRTIAGWAFGADPRVLALCPDPSMLDAELFRARATERPWPWHELDRERLLVLVRVLKGAYAPASYNVHATALRGVLKECWRSRRIDAEELAHRLDAIGNAKNVRIPRKPIEDGAVAETLKSARRGRKPIDARDYALLALAFGCGLRRGELEALDLAHVDLSCGRMAFVGKGSKPRAVYLPRDARHALERWLAVRGAEPGPLFTSFRKGGKVTGARLPAAQIFKLMREHSGGQLQPHDARRWNISTVREVADLETAQRQAGHSRIEQTAQYDTRWEKRLARVASQIELPRTL